LFIDTTIQYHPFDRLVHGDEYVSFSELQEESPHAAEHGDQQFRLVQTDFILRYGLSDRTEISVDVPYKWLHADSDLEDAHHRTESMDGFGDLQVRLKHFLVAEESWQMAGIVGLSIPTGELNKLTAASFLDHRDEHRIGVEAPRHSHLRLGTGTFDPIVGIEALYRAGNGWYFLGAATAILPFYENRYDYQTAPSVVLTAGPAVRVGDSPVIVGVFGEIALSEPDEFDGDDVVGPGGTFDGSFHVPNTGRFEFSLKPTVTWNISDRLTANIQGRFPLYTRIREGSGNDSVQATEEWSILFALSYGF
jgi:hypothetical protein